MKTKEQIELAEEVILLLQDYVELAKTERKVKKVESKEVVKEQIERLINETKNLVKEL
jgi:hypothetical protein